MIRWLALLALLAGTACSEYPGMAGTERGVEAAAWHEQGRQIYNYRCYFCHGYSGDARTLAASYLDRRPTDFTALDAGTVTVASLQATIAHGRTGTAMKGFSSILSDREIAAVADFVQREFIVAKAPNTRYHTAQNGWPDHDRYRDAHVFATGEIALDRPDSELSLPERRGKTLFMRSCISCHDRGRVTAAGDTWHAVASGHGHDEDEEYRPLPSAGVNPATPHDRPPRLQGLSTAEQRGEWLYQANCALCHAADGTGKNWMGRFLEPHPPDFTAEAVIKDMTRERLQAAIRDGIRDTSMPAWRSVLAEPDIDAIVDYINRAFRRQSVADSGK